MLSYYHRMSTKAFSVVADAAMCICKKKKKKQRSVLQVKYTTVLGSVCNVDKFEGGLIAQVVPDSSLQDSTRSWMSLAKKC